MNSYNGFTGAERQESWEQHKMMQKAGDISWADKKCEMCGQNHTNIMPHLENYFTPENFHALCIECHMNLHARFRAPIGWYRYLQSLRDGYKPKNWSTVMQFFRSKESKEIFRNSSEKPIFDVSNSADIQWFETLRVEPIDMRKMSIDSGWNPNTVSINFANYKNSKTPQLSMEYGTIFNNITDD